MKNHFLIVFILVLLSVVGKSQSSMTELDHAYVYDKLEFINAYYDKSSSTAKGQTEIDGNGSGFLFALNQCWVNRNFDKVKLSFAFPSTEGYPESESVYFILLANPEATVFDKSKFVDSCKIGESILLDVELARFGHQYLYAVSHNYFVLRFDISSLKPKRSSHEGHVEAQKDVADITIQRSSSKIERRLLDKVVLNVQCFDSLTYKPLELVSFNVNFDCGNRTYCMFSNIKRLPEDVCQILVDNLKCKEIYLTEIIYKRGRKYFKANDKKFVLE